MGTRLQVYIDCATQVGARETNEDSFISLVGESAPHGTLALLAVADGIGGRGTGASASSLAIRTLADVFSASCSIVESTCSHIPNLLRFAVQKANATVYQAQAEDEALRGMGTTCVAAAITDNAAYLVSIGDSRAYLLRQGKLIPLTEDEWVKRGDGVTLVRRAVGWQPILPTEPVAHDIIEGDILLLCTDGLTDALPDESIQTIIRSCDDGSVCKILSNMAASTPFADNVTVVAAKVTCVEN